MHFLVCVDSALTTVGHIVKRETMIYIRLEVGAIL